VEETVYVLKGKRKISWKSNGKVQSLEFCEGDALYFPYGLENSFINKAEEELWFFYSITNTNKTRE
jgi:oxalate decarboxylase/phosphoglucose isomerase-like protein (cupin superfamily)